MIDDAELNAQILAASETGDVENLSVLYRFAGEAALKSGNVNHGCFYLTHAYVYALDAGLDSVSELHATLVRYGREE